jgi:hypothetical protein
LAAPFARAPLGPTAGAAPFRAAAAADAPFRLSIAATAPPFSSARGAS